MIGLSRLSFESGDLDCRSGHPMYRDVQVLR